MKIHIGWAAPEDLRADGKKRERIVNDEQGLPACLYRGRVKFGQVFFSFGQV